MNATWFDGHTAHAFDVAVEPAANGIRLLLDGAPVEQVARADLVPLERWSDQLRFGHRHADGWRLILPLPVDPALMACLPDRARIDPALRRWPMAAALAGTALVTAALGALIAAPYAVARHLPMAWEERIGTAYDLPADYVACDNPAAQRALDALVDRLDPSARADGVTIRLLDVDEVNAAALPGQQIVVLGGLFDIVDDGDALAGIVAHELAHVRRRHVAAGMIRQLGIGTVVTLAGGGAIAGNGGNLLSLSYTRGAESEADGDAIAMLRRARIDPRATRRAFDKLRAYDSPLPYWAESHPPSAGRAALFARSYDPRMAYRPALSANEATPLFAACRDGTSGE